MNLNDLAHSILDSQQELRNLRSENEYLKQQLEKYEGFFYDTLRHNEQQMVGWLNLLIKPGVAEAIAK